MFFLVIFSFVASSQKSVVAPFLRTGDVFGTRAFIENKGQFDGLTDTDEKVLYAYQNGEEQLFFTSKGLIYKFTKARKFSEKEVEELMEGKKAKPFKSKAWFVHVNWENARPDLQLDNSEKQSWHYSYGSASLNTSGYKKLVYKNVYDHIDIEYTIPENKEDGIKYTFILHPGAELGKIQIVYSGDVKKIKRLGEDIVIVCPAHTITEHAPFSFYKSGSVVTSSFSLNKGRIGFDLPVKFNSEEDLLIDPWVSTLPSLSTNNLAYDVDFDNAGNLYVYGGGSANMAAACKIAKYSPTGTLLWTFQMILTAVSWNTAGLNGIPSNFTVNKTTQKVYTAETFGGKIVRLDVNGNYDNFIAPASFGWDEIWEMGFNPCTGTVYAFGGGTSQNKHAAIVNEVNASAPPVNLSGFTQTNQDILCQAIDETGSVFVAFTVPSTNTAVTTNYLLKANAGFNGNNWVQLTTYNAFIEYSNKPFFTGTPSSVLAPSSNGFNCLAVNNNFLFYYDGFNVAAYNKMTGVKIGTTSIPGYTALYQGGIAVDNCNNVYVGGNGVIHVFQFTGTSFLPLPNIPLGVNPAPKVYDIRLDKSTNILYVSGNKFAGTYTASAICNNTDQLAVTYTCGPAGSALAVASVTTSALNPQISYTWTGTSGIVSQTSNASTQNTVNNLPNGNYTVTVQMNAPCGPVYNTTVNINCPLCSVSIAGSVACLTSGFGFSLNVVNVSNYSAPPSYTWTGPSGYSSSNANSVFSNGAFGIYTLTASGGNCSSTATVLLNSPATVLLNTNASPATGCVGQNVILTANASGGTSPYSYSWSGGPTNAIRIVNENMAGNYVHTVTVSDAAKCSASSTINVVINPLPTLSVNNATACENSSAMLQASGADTYVWQPGNLVGNPIFPQLKVNGSFTVTGTLKGCSSTAIAQVFVLPAPKININPFRHSGCVPLCVNLSIPSITTGLNYSWYVNNALIASGTLAEHCFTTSGNYYVNLRAKDEKNCIGVSPLELVSVYPKPLANFSFSGDLKMPIARVDFSDASRESIWHYYWYFGDGDESTDKDPVHIFPEAAVYQTFLVVEDMNGCADTVSKFIKILESPALYIPNTFTPNGDGQNDFFYVKGTGVRDFKMRIYNRWGQKLFDTNDITASWDGSYLGTPVKEDTYAWQIIYTLVGHHTETISGHISVIR